MPDIDLDFPTSYKPSDTFKKSVTASMVQSGKLVRHPCGAYFQEIPIDDITGLAAIPYNVAAEFGYFKIDFLHLAILDSVSSKQEIRELIEKEPDWSILWNTEHTHKLFQLHKHFDILNTLRPKSVVELADCIALIRPNKRSYLEAYKKDKYKTRPNLYRQAGDDKSSFRKSHAIAYALTVVIQLHLISQGRL